MAGPATGSANKLSPEAGVFSRHRIVAARRTWRGLSHHFDVLACPRRGGRSRLVTLIEQAAAIERLLHHLDLPADIPAARPPPLPAQDFDLDRPLISAYRLARAVRLTHNHTAEAIRGGTKKGQNKQGCSLQRHSAGRRALTRRYGEPNMRTGSSSPSAAFTGGSSVMPRRSLVPVVRVRGADHRGDVDDHAREGGRGRR